MQKDCQAPFSVAELEDRFGLTQPREVIEGLEQFCALLHKWQQAKNLVSRETLGLFWTRHIVDSLQLAPLIPLGTRRLIDLGSGGGLPAIPLAIALADRDIAFVLIEANARKCSFLRTVARDLQLPMKVENARIEDCDSRETGKADVVTARALAPLPKLIGLSAPFLATGGMMLFPKGREHGEEITAADSEWEMDVVKHPSLTDSESAILELRDVRRRANRF